MKDFIKLMKFFQFLLTPPSKGRNNNSFKHMKNIGKISQIIGPVVDVKFAENLPKIYDALKVELRHPMSNDQSDRKT